PQLLTTDLSPIWARTHAVYSDWTPFTPPPSEQILVRHGQRPGYLCSACLLARFRAHFGKTGAPRRSARAIAQGVPPPLHADFESRDPRETAAVSREEAGPARSSLPLPAPPSPHPPPSLPHSPWRERLTEPGEETAFAAALPPRPALTRASSAGNGEQRVEAGSTPPRGGVAPGNCSPGSRLGGALRAGERGQLLSAGMGCGAEAGMSSWSPDS
ncbi:hypothetical protein LEMLEM_LOCUS27127, partial [Lemmus lemmus]